MLEVLQDRIEQGFYPIGKRLPSERKLAEEFHAPQSQVHRKMRQLVESGLLECYRGNGYFIRSGRPSAKRLHRVALCGDPHGSTPEKEDFYVGLLLNLAPEYQQDIQWHVTPQDSKEQNELFLQFIHEKVEGVICYPHFIKGFLPAFTELIRQGIPLIFWDFSPLPGIFPSVGIDHFHSCMLAAEVLSRQNAPVTYVGFQGAAQNHLKYEGFRHGCELFNVKVEEEIFFPYEDVHYTDRLDFKGRLRPGRLYFTSTRLLSSRLIGRMFDDGYLPGKDYRILTVDKVKFMDDSQMQLDTVMRNNTIFVRKLLNEMLQAISQPVPQCNDYRLMMEYIKGQSLVAN